MPVVAAILVGCHAVFPGHRHSVVIATERIVPAAGVFSVGTNHPAHVRIEDEALGEMCGMLGLKRVRHVVTLRQAIEVVEQSRDVGTALDIFDVQSFTASENERPARAWSYRVSPENRGRA